MASEKIMHDKSALFVRSCCSLLTETKTEAEDFLLLSVCLSYWPLVSINYTRNSVS